MGATQSDSAARLTGLVSMPTSLRQSSVARFGHRGALASLPGASPWKELAIAAMQATNGCDRDVAANARLRTAFANLDDEHKAQLAQIKVKVQKRARQILALFWLPIFVATGALETFSFGRWDGSEGEGMTPALKEGLVPGDLGYDPLGIKPVDDPELLLKRQNQELLHGRLAMIASAGQIAEGLFTNEKLH